MSNRSIILLVVAAVAIFLLTQTLYTVDPTKHPDEVLEYIKENLGDK